MTHVPGVRGIHHVAMAVEDLDAAIAWYESTLGASVELRSELPEQGVEAAALALGHGEVELIAPLGPDTAVARFLDKRGPGLHHVAYAVADIHVALKACADSGARLIDEQPRIGLHGVPIAFLHPSSTQGILVELVQDSGD